MGAGWQPRRRLRPGSSPADSAWKFAWLLQTSGSASVASQFDLRILDLRRRRQFQPAESNSGYAMFIQPGNYSKNSNNIGNGMVDLDRLEPGHDLDARQFDGALAAPSAA